MLNWRAQLGLVIGLLWLRFYPFHVILFACGTIVSVIGYIAISVKLFLAQASTSFKSSRRFRFTRHSQWEREIEKFDRATSNVNSHIVDSEKISVLLSELLDIIINEFITAWFSKISSSTLFEKDVKIEISHVLKDIAQRLQHIDYGKLITLELLPLFNSHFIAYTEAQKLVYNDTFDGSDTDVSAEILSHFNNGDLHVGVTRDQVDKMEINMQEKTYLRGRIKKLLSRSLSDGEKSNELVVLFVTEILACTILDNIFNLLTDPDFLNLQLIRVIGDNLKRRNQVKELRSALEEHTLSSVSNEKDMPLSATGDIANTIQESFLEDDTNDKTVIQLDHESVECSKADRLVALLKSSTQLKPFQQYLESKHKLYLLKFWEKIEESKPPLLDSFQDWGALSLTKKDCLEIKESYFDNGLIDIGGANLDKFKALTANGSVGDTLNLPDCKGILIKLQGRIFQELFAEYFYNFLSAGVAKNHVEKVDEGGAVVDQIEDKLATIMSDPKYDVLESFSVGSQNEKFGSELYEKLSPLNRTDRYSKLFEDDEEYSEDEDDSDELDTDSDSVIMKESCESMELAGPGNLNLAEEKIPALEKEIENLNQQLIYLEPLLRKAQLTNDQSKLKLLLKSKNGVQKDIALKELQKQQYIVQESDNSLFGKSKVSILSIVHQNDKTREFVLYIIEVQKFSTEDPNVVKAGWVVARRYSQFHRLHGYLKRRYPKVSSLSFPQKSILVLKFQQKNITESRRHQLEAYLKALIEIPEVCSDMAFRSFLSSENFHLGKHQRFDEPRKLSALFGYRWYLSSSSNRNTTSGQYSTTPPTTDGSEFYKNRREMEVELRQFDEKPTSKPLFIKPICDLVITVFNLHWLKGRALVVILQQFFGTAVENKVYDVIRSNLNESNISSWLTTLRELLFPNGKFKLEPAVRSKQQQLQTRQEAKQLFDTFMTETCSKIVGSENTANAATTIFLMLQVSQLNKDLLFHCFDVILDELTKHK